MLFVIIKFSRLIVQHTSYLEVLDISLVQFLRENSNFFQIRRDCAVSRIEIQNINFQRNTVVFNNSEELEISGKYALSIKLNYSKTEFKIID